MRTRLRGSNRSLGGYPRQYESVATLADGRTVQVRPIVPADAAELAEAIRTADAESLHSRFLGGPPSISDAVMKRLTCLDYEQRFALVAHSGGRGVAVARYEGLAPEDDGTTTAEVAVAVAPEWRGVGLATLLVGQLAQRAQECGFTHLSALFLAQNRPVAELARAAHGRVTVLNGAAELDVDLATTADSWPPLAEAGVSRS